jgi:polysaccharide biosynthesis transport protein
MTGQIQPTVRMTTPIAPRPPVSVSGPMAMTPKEIVGIFRRHIWLIILFTMAGVIIGGTAWFLMRKYAPKYTAITAINVLPPVDVDPMQFSSVQPNKDLYFQFRSTKAAFMKQQYFYQELLRKDKIRQTKWFARFNNDIADAVENLEDNLRVSPQREGNWITVTMTCGSKKESASIVNEAVNLFLSMQRDIATRDIRGQLAKWNTQQSDLVRQLDGTESLLDTLRKSTGFTNLEGTAFRDYMDGKLEDLEQKFTESNSDKRRLDSLIVTLRRRADEPFDEVLREQMERDPTASQMRSSIYSLELSLSQLLSKFGEDHKRVREIRDALKQAKAELASRQNEIADIQRRANLRNAEDQLTILADDLEETTKRLTTAKTEARQLEATRAAYERLSFEREKKRELIETVTTKIEKLNAQYAAPDISKVSKVNDAQEPLQISSPKIIIYVPAGFMLGFLVGVGLAFAIEMLNDLVRTPSDVMKHLRVPLLGMVFHEQEDDDVEGVDLCHVVRQSPYSITSECYRQLKTNLQLSGAGQSRKSLFITSASAGDGKTSVAVNLASTLVAEDKKVLFVDSNFRRPAAANMFPHAEDEVSEHPDFGLSNYLVGQCEYQNIIRSSGIEGFDIIDSGPLPSHPAELLGNSAMRDLLEKMKREYDYVIIDGPPMFVSDAKTLASEVDGVILVFNATATRRGVAQRVLRELRDIKAELVGTVLLGVRTLKGGYFHEAQKSYHDYQQVPVAQEA